MNHLEEPTIERYVLGAPSVQDASERIQQHLKECPGCNALYLQILEYYREVDRLKDSHEQALVLGAAFSGRKASLPPAASVVQRGIGQLRNMVFRHPVRASASAVGILSLAGLLLLQTPSDSSPAFARAKGEFLVVYDNAGNELWRKHFGMGYAPNSNYSIRNPESAASVVDVDGDGTKEIIVSLLPPPNTMDIVCYSAEGNERWRYSFSRTITFGATEFSDDYEAVFLKAGDFDRDGEMEIIGAARHRTYFPDAVFRLNAATGAFEAEYWHCGWLVTFETRDLDGDGVEEFLFGGQNNAFDRAVIIVLDPRFLSGAGPTSENFRPDGKGPGSQRFYVMLPRTEFGVASRKPRSFVNEIVNSGDLLQMSLIEFIGEYTESSAYLYFDLNLRCVRVGETDELVVAHTKLKSSGTTRKPLDRILQDLRTGIRYWDGRQFVESPPVHRNPAIP